MLYSVFVKVKGEGEWQKLAWNQTKKQAQALVLSVMANTESTAEYRPQ